MYVHFAYAHKASYASVDDVPYVKHKVRLHVVNQPWLETQATSTLRLTSVPWSVPYLDLTGTDAESSHLSTTTMNIASPSRFVEFKVGSNMWCLFPCGRGTRGTTFGYLHYLYLGVYSEHVFLLWRTNARLKCVSTVGTRGA